MAGKSSQPPTPRRHPGFIAGNWYHPTDQKVAAGTAPGVNSIRLLPFMMPAPITISDLGVSISVADAAGHVQVAFYASDATAHLPTGTAIASTGDIATTPANGEVSATITGGNKTLAPGLYWMAMNTDSATAAIQTLDGGNTQFGYLVGSATISDLSSANTTDNIVLTFAQTYNTWPDLTGQTFGKSTTQTSANVFMKAA